jgi:hypothetical protein
MPLSMPCWAYTVTKSTFLGHEILFYGGEILLGQPVKKHLFKSVCTYSQKFREEVT